MAFVATTALAEVRVQVATTTPDAQGNVTVDVILHTDGESVGGFQNDIVFDHTAVHLDSCRINPAIGTTPLTGPGDVTCAEDASIGPCKTLSQSVTTCAGDPFPPGCPAETPDYSRFRAIVAGTAVPNENSIPAGLVTYTCIFTVVSEAALPVRLFNSNVVVSDPVGNRLPGSGADGGVCVDDAGSQRCAPLRPIDGRCTIDFECESGHCDRCCGHQFNGICAAPRTATPTDAPPPTRTPTATRTVTSTRTATAPRPPTSTPIPALPGDACNFGSACVPGFACNYDEGFICCSSDRCPDGMSCRVAGLEGYCLVPPTSSDAVTIRFDRGAPDADDVAELVVSVHSNGASVGGMQNDVVFDNTVVSFDATDCRINPVIGLLPFGDAGPSCLDDPSIGPCKNLGKVVSRCGVQPQPSGCPPGAGGNTSIFRGIVAATAAPNSNAIPDGPLYTCAVRVLDPVRLPSALSCADLVVSDPFGVRLPVFAEGTCSDKRAEGDGCNYASDCQSGSCDLVRETPFSDFRGVCGDPRAPQTHAGECEGGGDCTSGNCVDGFCCATGACAAGQFCNSGECAPPAEPGAPCTTDEQCALGLCVDGACCVTGACADGLSCNVPTRAGACREPFRLGSGCTMDDQCPTGFCTDSNCCESASCVSGTRCDVAGDEGSCALPPPPTSTPLGGSEGDGGGGSTPTPLAPPSSGQTPSATPNPFGSIADDGCTLSPRRPGVGLLWPLTAAGMLVGWRLGMRRRLRASDHVCRRSIA